MGKIARIKWQKFLPGDPVPDDHEQLAWALRNGIIQDEAEYLASRAEPSPAPQTEAVRQDAPAEPPAGSGVKRPSKAAKLAAWQDYARSQGLDPKKMTREELIARFT